MYIGVLVLVVFLFSSASTIKAMKLNLLFVNAQLLLTISDLA